MRLSRVHCAVLNARTGMVQVHRVTAAMARGKRPVSFRTRKLSLSAPMVLPWRRGGRVGRRRTTIPEGAPASVLGPLRHTRTTTPGTFGTESPPRSASAAGAGVLRRRSDVVPEPGVQRPDVAPRGADLLECTALVQPLSRFPVPAYVQGL